MLETNQTNALTFRAYRATDYPALKKLMQYSYSELTDACLAESTVLYLSELYPDGQILCFWENQLIGAVLNRIVPACKYQTVPNERHVLNESLFEQDMQEGDSVYSLDFVVHPAYQNLKLGKKLHAYWEYQSFKDNFVTLIGASRLPNYHLHAHALTCEQYVEAVKNRELSDPILGFHLSNKIITGDIIPNYNPEDKKSCGYGVVVFLPNPNYDPQKSIYPQRNQRAQL